jgi:hypothetical protein
MNQAFDLRNTEQPSVYKVVSEFRQARNFMVQTLV